MWVFLTTFLLSFQTQNNQNWNNKITGYYIKKQFVNNKHNFWSYEISTHLELYNNCKIHYLTK